jgi:hypothetical protein
MPANTSFTSGQILTAAQMTALPWGVVNTTSGGTSSRGYFSITTATTNAAATGIVDVTGATMTFTGIAGRLYKITITGAASSTSSNGLCDFKITDGSNVILQQQREEMAGNGFGQLSMVLIFTLTGSATYKLRMDSVIADTTFGGAVPNQGTMVIEDIGVST